MASSRIAVVMQKTSARANRIAMERVYGITFFTDFQWYGNIRRQSVFRSFLDSPEDSLMRCKARLRLLRALV